MKASAILVLFACTALAGCSAAEQEKTLSSEKGAISKAQKDTQVTAAKTGKELQDLKNSTITGVKNLREGATKGAAALGKETESGAHALEQGAKSVEQLSHDAATHAAAVGDAVKRFDQSNTKTDTPAASDKKTP